MTLVAGTRADVPTAAEASIRQFLAQQAPLPAYHAARRLEAENGDRSGWLEADTAYSAQRGFSYTITAQGGSGFVRERILKAVLDGERELIARGNAGHGALSLVNYTFDAAGIDAEGLANVLLSPRRRDDLLVAGTLFLRQRSGDPVRLQGRLVKSPSFWVKNVDILWSYGKFDRATMPVALHSSAEIRFFGPASLSVTYRYSEIAGHPVERGLLSLP